MNGHAFVTAHGDDITFQVTYQRRVTALIDRKRTEAMLTGVGIGLCHNPSRSIADAEIQDLALTDQRVQGLH